MSKSKKHPLIRSNAEATHTHKSTKQSAQFRETGGGRRGGWDPFLGIQFNAIDGEERRGNNSRRWKEDQCFKKIEAGSRP